MIKFGFVTCVQLGLSCMETIYRVGGKLHLVVTLNDDQAKNKSGRVYLDGFCESHDTRLVKSTHVNNQEVIKAIQDEEIDWLFIIGWSQIASTEVLASPKQGVLGIHPTLLPEGRGRAAIPWAIIKNLSKTGVTMFKLDEGIDTGPIVAQLEIPLSADIDATSLYSLVDEAHINLIEVTIPKLLDESLVLEAQDDSKATMWPGRSPEDGLIDINDSVYKAERLVRALKSPYPGAFITDTKKYIIWDAIIVEDPQGDFVLEFPDGYLKVIQYETEALSK